MKPRTCSQAGVLPVVLAVTALLATACGAGGGSAGGSSAGGTTDYQKAVAYAQCMRSHGVPNFPDPDSKGHFIIRGSELGGSQGQRAAADRACRHLLPNGGEMTAQQQQKALAQGLKLAACIRSHGVPNFPDPVVRGDGISINIGQTGLGPNSPVLKAAMRACRKYQPFGGS